MTPDSSTSPSPSWGVRNEGSAPEPCEVCTASAEEASRVLEKAWKDPRRACVRKRLNHERWCGRSQAMRGASFPCRQCREMWVGIWMGMCAAGQSSASGVAATASSACSFEWRAGLGDLRHRGINPPVSRALGRPTAFSDWHRSFGSGVTRSPPLFEVPPDASGLTSHTHWQSRTPKWRLFVVARTRELASETASVKKTEKRRPSQQGSAR